MKNRSYILLIISAFLIIGVGSCTIKKRSYQPGYYVDWYNVNKKSKSNSENVSEKNREILNEKNEVIEAVAEQNEIPHNPTTAQDNSPVFTSTDENQSNVEIITATEQSKQIDYKSLEVKSDVDTPVSGDFDPESLENEEVDLPVHDLATTGLVLSALAVIFFIGLLLSNSVLDILFLFLPAFIFGILGIAISATAIIIILLNQDKYSGLWLAIVGLAIPFVLLLLLTIV